MLLPSCLEFFRLVRSKILIVAQSKFQPHDAFSLSDLDSLKAGTNHNNPEIPHLARCEELSGAAPGSRLFHYCTVFLPSTRLPLRVDTPENK